MSLTKVSHSMISNAPVYVEDFGATTSDTVGTTNLAAIQAAIDTGKDVCFNGFYTVNGPIKVFNEQRLFTEKSWTNYLAGINFKITSVVDIDLITGKNGSYLQDTVFEALSFVIDVASTFLRTTTVRMIYGAGRRIQLRNVESTNKANAPNVAIATISAVGAVASVTTATAHGLSNGTWIRVTGVGFPDGTSSTLPYSGLFQISSVGASSFDYTMGSVPLDLTPAINAYYASFQAESAGTIAFSRFLYLDGALIPTFELMMDGCLIYGGYNCDVQLQGSTAIPAGNGLMVGMTITNSQINSQCNDWTNGCANIALQNGNQNVFYANILGSLSSNFRIGGDNESNIIAYNYYEGSNSGLRRIGLFNNTISTLISESIFDPTNGSIYSETLGTYSFYGHSGIVLKSGMARLGSLLKNYEVGTLTATFSPTTGAFTVPPVYLSQAVNFVRIGNVVTVTVDIRTTSMDIATGTPAGAVKINCLPYSIANNGSILENVGAVVTDNVGWGTGAPNIVIGSEGNKYVTPYYTVSNSANVAKIVSELATGANANHVLFTMTYITDES